MSRLIVIAQKVDENDDHRSFFIGWLREFGKRFDEVSVITLSEGVHNLPSNVHVYSLGKESGASRLTQAWRFYRLLFRLVPGVHGVFAHASPIFVIAAWPLTFLWRKKLVLWYLHRSNTVKLRVALSLCDTLVTADASSLTIESPKILAVGHGIETARFAVPGRTPPAVRPLRILSVGRITPIKGFETLIRAAARMREHDVSCEVRIVGKAVMPGDHAYEQQLQEMTARLGVGDIVHFFPPVPYRDIHEHFQWADIVVGCTPPGGIDKVILEGMAAGCIAFTSNSVMRAHLGDDAERLLFPAGDFATLADAVERTTDYGELSERLVHCAGRHNLDGTISAISDLL